MAISIDLCYELTSNPLCYFDLTTLFLINHVNHVCTSRKCLEYRCNVSYVTCDSLTPFRVGEIFIVQLDTELHLNCVKSEQLIRILIEVEPVILISFK
jgi:hypothetical protein